MTEKSVFSASSCVPYFFSAQYFDFGSSIARHPCALALKSLGLEPVDAKGKHMWQPTGPSTKRRHNTPSFSHKCADISRPALTLRQILPDLA